MSNTFDVYTVQQINALMNELNSGLKINGTTKISKDGIITISRGDTLDIPVILTTGNPLSSYEIELGQGDLVEFRLFYPNDKWENAIIRKECDENDVITGNIVIFNITSEESLELTEGIYYYEVKLTYYVNDIQKTTTLIPRRRFYVTN